MTNVIVAFSKQEDAKSIKNILMRSGFQVIAVCMSGAQIINQADVLNSGIVVCGYRFADMMFNEIYECISPNFDMLLISSPERFSNNMPGNIVCLPMPLKIHDLVNTLHMMTEAQIQRRKKKKQQPKERSREEQELIDRAKGLLMERNNMSEIEAHRYIQRCSMDSGTNMVETAQMVMSLINI